MRAGREWLTWRIEGPLGENLSLVGYEPVGSTVSVLKINARRSGMAYGVCRGPQATCTYSTNDQIAVAFVVCAEYAGKLGPLAQLVEQVALNYLVEGSSPSRPTIFPRLPASRCKINSS